MPKCSEQRQNSGYTGMEFKIGTYSMLTSDFGSGDWALATTTVTALASFIAAMTGSSGELSTNRPLI